MLVKYLLILLLVLMPLTMGTVTAVDHVKLRYSYNGDGWREMTCEGTLTFHKKDIVAFLPQKATSQCNCQVSLRDTHSKDEAYVYGWKKDHSTKRLASDAILYNYRELVELGILKTPLKIDIQPAEKYQVKFFDKRPSIEEIPFRVLIRGNLEMMCSNNKTYEALFPPPTKPSIISLSQKTSGYNNTGSSNDVENGTVVYGRGEGHETKVSVFTQLERPTHNNTIVIGIICVLIAIIIFSSSLILVSLVMHRKRLARRLAVHLHNIEEARRQEAIPLAQSLDQLSNKRVKLISMRKLSMKYYDKSEAAKSEYEVGENHELSLLHEEDDGVDNSRHCINTGENKDSGVQICDSQQNMTNYVKHETFSRDKPKQNDCVTQTSSASQCDKTADVSCSDNMKEPTPYVQIFLATSPYFPPQKITAEFQDSSGKTDQAVQVQLAEPQLRSDKTALDQRRRVKSSHQ